MHTFFHNLARHPAYEWVALLDFSPQLRLPTWDVAGAPSWPGWTASAWPGKTDLFLEHWSPHTDYADAKQRTERGTNNVPLSLRTL